LPPAVQEQLRGRYEAFMDLPQDRRQAVRQELQRLKNLPPRERNAELSSPQEQQNFSPDELEIIQGVAGTR
jgi:hypothetical protein